MKRPMPVFLFFLIFGIIWGSLSLSAGWFFAVSIFAFALAALFLCFFKIKPLAGLSLVFVLGFILSHNKFNSSSPFWDGIAESKTPVTFEAQVTDSSKNSFTLKTKPLTLYGYEGESVKILCYPDDTENNENNALSYKTGDILKVTGKISALSPKYNPCDFDEINYYKCRGISYKIYSPEITKTDHKTSLFSIMSDLREAAAHAFDNMYSPEEAGVLKAMLLGDKDYLTDDIKQIYKTAGIYHVLAISGLHITLIAAALMFIFRKARHAPIIISILFLYCLFTGLSPSTVRAVLMAAVLLFGRLLNRRYDLLSSIAFSAFIILLTNPMYIYDCGFIYSYTSVLGIALFANSFSHVFSYVTGKKYRLQRYLSGALGASLSAVIISKLTNLWFFYTVSVYDLITNLLVLPLVAVVLLSGALSAVFYALGLGLWRFFAYAAHSVLSFYTAAAKTVSALPFSLVTLGKPIITFVLLYLLFIVLLKLSICFKRKSIGIAALFCLVLGVALQASYTSSDRLSFLYVGQGDGAVGVLNKTVFAVDGGGSKDDIAEKDEGVCTMLPYLNYIGKTRLDIAFASHIDNDHLKGIYELIGNIGIGEIYLPKSKASSDLLTALEEKAAKYNVPIKYISAGDVITRGNASFECVYPTEEAAESSDPNTASMVLKISNGSITYLFTGDLTAEGEADLLKTGANIKADVLKMPHHGSKYSSSKEFLAAVSPSLAVISCGRNNIYGFPNEETTSALDDLEIPYLTTSENGALTTLPEKDRVKVKTQLNDSKPN